MLKILVSVASDAVLLLEAESPKDKRFDVSILSACQRYRSVQQIYYIIHWFTMLYTLNNREKLTDFLL